MRFNPHPICVRFDSGPLNLDSDVLPNRPPKVNVLKPSIAEKFKMIETGADRPTNTLKHIYATKRRTDKQAGRQKERQADRLMQRREAGRRKYRMTVEICAMERQTYRKTNRRAKRQADRHTGRQTERQR